jgi:hypothetical protein
MTRATIQAIEPGSGPAGLRRNWTRLSDERAATSPPPLWATESTQVVRAPLSAACDDVGGAKEQGRVPLPWMGRGQGWGENAGKRPMRWHASSAAAGRREERRGMVALASPTPSPSPRHVEDMPSAWWGGESGRICGAVTVSIDRRDRRNKMCEHPSLVGEGQGGGIPGGMTTDDPLTFVVVVGWVSAKCVTQHVATAHVGLRPFGPNPTYRARP